MESYFSLDMSGIRFLRNVLLFSIAGLIPPLALFVFLSPGFAAALSQGGPALLRFLRQVLTNGLPVVFVINYVSFFLYASSKQQGRRGHPVALVATDILARLALFFGLHAMIYILSADWYGSFGGSRLTAISVVAPTLSRSAFFENISGVYFYATLVSAVPLYVSAFTRLRTQKDPKESMPSCAVSIAFAIAMFASTGVLLTVLSETVTRFQG
ncbi:hypothetical protein [Sulfitobacter mediterraneus]|uniref:Uncharacterized protein n=1 Tax=Sulfitobacter mediterraneus TaxID=83219 RepID=A0A061SR71_9RHOB|nr:hypothetical protein [Sulfitobacter mediterraneus]KAJ01725.1 hypothetical protein PM02_17655 [Sulfitobacter mediterraneus]